MKMSFLKMKTFFNEPSLPIREKFLIPKKDQSSLIAQKKNNTFENDSSSFECSVSSNENTKTQSKYQSY
jgi:hypothetical protein